MANIKSEQKRLEVRRRNNERNSAAKSETRTAIKKAEVALAAGNKEEAMVAFKVAESEMMRAAQKGVFHKNTATRTVSRLAQKIKAL